MALLTWIQGLIGGLLISSCCLIQLFLNLFGIGCAGLNTFLLPYRPLFISLTIVWLTYGFYRSRPSKWHLTILITLTVLLSLSPELLRMYNNAHSSIAPEQMELRQTHWQIEGMHCEACRSAVLRALKSLDGVEQVNVNLETSEAVLSSRLQLDPEKVRSVIQSVGFDVKPR